MTVVSRSGKLLLAHATMAIFYCLTTLGVVQLPAGPCQHICIHSQPVYMSGNGAFSYVFLSRHHVCCSIILHECSCTRAVSRWGTGCQLCWPLLCSLCMNCIGSIASMVPLLLHVYSFPQKRVYSHCTIA